MTKSHLFTVIKPSAIRDKYTKRHDIMQSKLMKTRGQCGGGFGVIEYRADTIRTRSIVLVRVYFAVIIDLTEFDV